MGNTLSTYSDITDNNISNTLFFKTIYAQVAYYILTMTKKSINSIQDIEYCNSLINIVSEILCNNLSHDEKMLLYNHIYNYTNISDTNIICNKIAIFFIKVAHLYAVIISNTSNVDNIDNVTNVNKQHNTNNNINEWMDLYFDNGYDLESGKFLNMSNDARNDYNDDLQCFYVAFTDDNNKPDNINYFNDIKLLQHGGSINNSIKESDDTKKYLITKYASHLKEMMISIRQYQDMLINILKQLFTTTEDPITNNNIYILSLDLNNHILDSFIQSTREIIIQLYVKTQEYALESSKIYEAISEILQLNTLQRQIIDLEKTRHNLSSF